jgi:hypothetical protein
MYNAIQCKRRQSQAAKENGMSPDRKRMVCSVTDT